MNKALRMPVMRGVLALGVAALVALPAHAGGNVAGPERLSGLNGWHGVTVKREGEQCRVSFPKNFGATPPELGVLLRMANHDEKFRDVDCYVDIYAPLNQLKRLAVEEQNETAARLILFAPETGKLDIDGEVAEGFANDYQTPVLMGYKNLSAVIPGASEARLAQDVCTGMYYGDSENPPDENVLAARLNAAHMEALAAKVKRECAKAAKEGGAGPK